MASTLTDEDRRLWKKYFGADMRRGNSPAERDDERLLALRCSACAYVVSGWIHIDWHEVQPEWKSDRMRRERIEKLGS